MTGDITNLDGASSNNLNQVTLSLSKTSMTLTEGMSDTVDIVLATASTKSISLSLDLSSATGVNRFNPIPSSIVIPAGQTRMSVLLNTFDDVLVQPQEIWTLTVTLSSDLNANPCQLLIYLNDNDGGTTVGAGTSALGPLQLKELNLAPAGISSIAMSTGKVIFTSTNPTYGTEPWVTDGTDPGTFMLKDIYPGLSSSNPINFFSNASKTIVYFSATTPGEGSEIWRTDGTSAGTYLLADITPGVGSTSGIYLVGNIGSFTVFRTTVDHSKLWVTDGTSAGTMLLTPGIDWTNISAGVTMGSALYFGAGDPVNGSGIWKTDGTTAGTVAVQITEPLMTSAPSNFSLWNNKVYFVGDDWTNGTEDWVSDGTAAGTMLLQDIYSGFAGGAGTPSGSLGTKLFLFNASDSTASAATHIWTTDGTHAGTTYIAPGVGISSVIGNIAGKIIFGPTDGTGTLDWEPWVTDGTVPGTFLLKNINPSASGLALSSTNSITLGSLVLFTADDGVNGTELWATDGTSAGTILVKDINPGGLSSFPDNFYVMGSKAVFTATSAAGRELWVTDGTTAGTYQMADIAPGPSSSNPKSFNAIDANRFVFVAYNTGANFATLFVGDLSNNTVKGFNQVLEPTAGAQNSNLVSFGSSIYFGASANGVGSLLWKTDGTSAGTVAVKDIFPSSTCTDISNLTVIGSSLFFTASGQGIGKELWISDGTSAGTNLLVDINSGLPSSSPYGLTPVPGSPTKFVFGATSAAEGTEPWVSDGTAAGTILLKDIDPGVTQGFLGATANAIQGLIYIRCFIDTSFHFGSYVTDGTVAGTHQLSTFGGGSIVDLGGPFHSAGTTYFRVGTTSLWQSNGVTTTAVSMPGVTLSNSVTPIPNGSGGIYFVASTAATGMELWYYDGVTPPTGPMVDMAPGTSSPGFNSTTYNLGSKLIFSTASDLWVTDGTTAGTLKLATSTFIPGSALSSAIFGGKLYFKANQLATTGAELWVTDGTVAGTYILKDINPGTASSDPAYLTIFNSKLYFTANDGVHGTELWVTDGTAAGTVLLEDINPGLSSSSPYGLQVINGKLFMNATTDLSGSEIWVMAP